MSAEPPSVHIERFVVRSYEVDPSGRATPQTLGDYFQEAAANHAHRRGLDGDAGSSETGWTWVLNRLRLRIHRFPAWREPVTVETWASGFAGALATREALFLSDAQERLAEATSRWIVIDLATRRPRRPPAGLAALPRPDRPRPFGDDAPPPEAPEDAPHTVRFTVRHSDLDVNRHVNNMCYLNWALEAVPPDFRERHALSEVDLLFKAESVFGDIVASEAAPKGDGWAHRLARPSDGTTLALLRTAWTRP